ncbi:hypothetical protein [Streptomyces benahoarensis]|uniref:WXG100-like domain-containing protein n=1 Tax=Streptomyces benahoarensis TaxID=2595054 RepID=UPI00163D7222|nr:hypothetical protein [Streptomyces benahoarensis]
MIDAHHIPPDLQNLLLVVVGNKWPTGDETALRAEAAAWREVADALDECVRDVTEAWRAVDAGLEGATRAGVDAFLATLIGRPGVEDGAVLPTAIRCCGSAADALDALANEVETLRIEILGALIVLAVQLTVDAVAFLFGGAEAAAVEIAAARVLCLAFLRQAAVRVLTRVAESVLAQEGFALLAQVTELAQGHRGTLDGQQLTVAAVNGAIGGAVGFGTGLAGGALGHGLGKGLRTAGLGPAVRGAADVVRQGGYGAVAGMAEGAAQDAAFGLSGDWVSGAANGAFNGAWGARHTGMNPKNLGSLSPADRLEGAVEGLLRPPSEGTRGPLPEAPPSPGLPAPSGATPERMPSSGLPSPSGATSSLAPSSSAGTSPDAPASLHGDEFTGPGERHDEPTGLEGPEVWQDGEFVPVAPHEEGPGPMASFAPEPNPWTGLSPDGHGDSPSGSPAPSLVNAPDQDPGNASPPGPGGFVGPYGNPWADGEPG